MPRICFEFQVGAEHLTRYLAHHREVWPEMLEEIADAGIHNYSIFHAGDGRMIGYYETADTEATDRRLAASPIAKRWDHLMRPMFVALSDGDGSRTRHPPEIFNLEEQLGTRSSRRLV